MSAQASGQNAASGVDRLREWREEYRKGLAPSALQDVEQLGARLELTHAHPSGIARLFASGQVTLSALFRDNGMLRTAERRLDRVLDDRAAKGRIAGLAELSLVVGVATWRHHHMPVLLYPVEASGNSKASAHDASVTFVGRVQLNAAFVSALRERGVRLDERALFDGSNYASGTPETSAVFAAITEQASGVLEDFSIERQIILGCFMDPATQLLVESQTLIAELSAGATGNTLVDALAGYEQADKALREDVVAQYSPFDGDPHAEYAVGDVDNAVRYAANIAAAGHSLMVDSSLGADTAQQAAAIASRCVMAGKSVLYVPGVADQRRRFTQVMSKHDLQGLILDLSEEQMASSIDRRLIEAVGFRGGNAKARFDQLSDELVGVRSRLTRYLGDLHGVNERWGVSAYQTIQNLANIASMPTHPCTRVRLTQDTARSIAGHMEDWVGKLERAGEVGEYTITEQDTAWFKASITSEDEAVAVYQRVMNLLQQVLPATREQVTSTVQTCGFSIPSTAQEWGREVAVLKNLRRVLDVFQPEIFERDIAAMIEATRSKADRKANGSSMGFWERRRHMKEARGLLRVGAQVENLHEALKVVAKQSEQWHMFAPRGGWPVLPGKLDDIVATQEALSSNMTALNAVLATTPQGGNLETADFNEVEARLKRLLDDHRSLDTLPERCRLEREFQTVGLTALVDDLRERGVSVASVGAELQLAWWTTVFEDIVRSSAMISNQDGSALQTAADRFAQVDVEHVRSVGPMVAQESMRRLCDMLFAHTQEANVLHTALAGQGHVAWARLRRDHPQIMAAATPVLMATPATLAALTEPAMIADVAIVDAGAHMPSVQLLAVLSRVRHVVVLGHRETMTCESLKTLVDMLPRVQVDEGMGLRSPLVGEFLQEHGYGAVRYEVAVEGKRGAVRFHQVEANGIPVMSTGLVESSQQEVDEVVRIIMAHASRFTIVPAQYTLTVVALTSAFRMRLGADLKSLAAKNRSMGKFLRHVRIVDIADVAGAYATDVIIACSYAKTAHGRLLQQFGSIEGDSGCGMLLDALALAQRHVDIVASFDADDMDDERIHQPGPKLLKDMLRWAKQAGETNVEEQLCSRGEDDVLFTDLAQRLRARGLCAQVEYGYEHGDRLALAVGLPDKPLMLAVLTDNAQFMGMQSTRERHRVAAERLHRLGWSVMTVWSVGSFVNPDKEVDRIVARLGELYREA